MIQLNDRNESIDLITLKAEIEKSNSMEDIGGLTYLTELSQASPSAASIAYYAKNRGRQSDFTQLDSNR